MSKWFNLMSHNLIRETSGAIGERDKFNIHSSEFLIRKHDIIGVDIIKKNATLYLAYFPPGSDYARSYELYYHTQEDMQAALDELMEE